MLKNILIIDDSKLMRERIHFLLKEFQSSCNIIEAADSFEGERLVKQIKPEIVILDISMPERNGIEFLYALKGNYDNSTIIVFTNFSSDLYKQKVEELGASYFLSKHEDIESLQIIVGKILTNGNDRRASGF